MSRSADQTWRYSQTFCRARRNRHELLNASIPRPLQSVPLTVFAAHGYCWSRLRTTNRPASKLRADLKG